MAKPDPESSVGYLLADVSRLLRRDFDRRVRDLKLTQAQWRAIAHLELAEGMNQATLADRLDVTPITLARLVDRLEEAGWVERKTDPSDRRASQLFLTTKVGPILKQMHAHADVTLRDLLAGISATAQRQLIKTLQQMKQNLNDSAEAASDLQPPRDNRYRKNGRR